MQTEIVTIESVNFFPVEGKKYQDVKLTANGKEYRTKSFNVKTPNRGELFNGMVVELRHVPNGQYTNIEVHPAPANAAPTATSAPVAQSTQHQAVGDPRQVSIEMQNSRTAAIETVRLLIDTGAISKTAAKDESVILSSIDHYTGLLFDQLQQRKADPKADVSFPTTETQVGGSE